MKPNWIDLGPIDELPEGKPSLRQSGGRRFVCVRQGGEVRALDDRCPHQGYPLSQGKAAGSVLTCEWHNWKFELTTGACLFGGEAARSYPTRIDEGRVLLNAAIDTAAEARRLVAGLREALRENEPGRALREGLRLGALGISPEGEPLGALYPAFELLARDGAERARYGFDHGLAVLADLAAWVERGLIPADEAFVVASQAIGEASQHLGPRAAPQRATGLVDARRLLTKIADIEVDEPRKITEALKGERRDEAEARMRALVPTRGARGAIDALLPFLCEHLYDYGHSAIFATKACELALRFPAAAVPVLASLTVSLGWATAETSLPPFTATRAALARLAEANLPAPAAGREIAWDRPAYEASVLVGEAQAVQATASRLAEGCDPTALLRGVAHAAAERLGRFDAAWEQRLDAEVTVLGVTHAVTFAEAAIALSHSARATREQAASLAVIAAGFVGKLKHADAAAPPAAGAFVSHGGAGDLLAAARSRDVTRALAAARDLDRTARLAAYDTLAPFAAFEATVRPIFTAHAVKVTESLRRLDATDPEADGVYLQALLAYLVPLRPETRARRIAAVARKFLTDSRPPEGLY
jgi:nitrite reductase/ring-hydroxylating ferredoxin subunit